MSSLIVLVTPIACFDEANAYRGVRVCKKCKTKERKGEEKKRKEKKKKKEKKEVPL